MDWVFRSVLTSAAVLLVLTAAKHFGPRVAGLVAALPLVTAPALVWLAHEQGTAFAVGAAVSSVAACAMLAVFASAFAIVARVAGAGLALAAGGLAAAAMTLPTLAAGVGLGRALAFALIFCVVAHLAMPARCAVAVRCPASPLGSTGVAVMVGIFTALLATVGPALGDTATGVLSSLPLIGGAAAIREHAHGGHRASSQFLRGYVAGLFGKAAFGAAFALLAPALGSELAVVLACVAASLVSLVNVCRWNAVSALGRCPQTALPR